MKFKYVALSSIFVLACGGIYLLRRDRAPGLPAKNQVPANILSQYESIKKDYSIHSLRLCTVDHKKIYQVVRSTGFAWDEYYYSADGHYLGKGSGDDVVIGGEEYDVQPPIRVTYRNCTDLNY
jgi:hypothetical protein